ncbi:subtilosin A family bacteriocin [Bacillus sp. C28GYM-DRY-1]|uniref:subtilosin A family bacteriocin n=1 Tax=Bacillus sp. C28GYM-DRY-1 TaxID=3062686 RepID=UPI0026767CEC|nr:subtilosin A family bacteriocin [Bacillus sp. C28GYM-DRY-1]MDO3662309.1 subtilosin A family bacteriocin [Bacillus sp. C28GYM-DRY-1]
MKKAVIVENKGCATCSIGAAYLVDGPIPDFEIAGATGLFGLRSMGINFSKRA